MRPQFARSGSRTVLWLHQYYFGPEAAGSERPRVTLEGFASRGWRVRLVGARDGYQEADASPAGGVARFDGVCWEPVPLRRAGPDFRTRSYWEFFWRGLRAAVRGPRPDLVFCSSPPLPQALQAGLVARRWSIPMVLEVRDLWPTFLEELQLISSPAALALLRRLERVAYRSASRVVSASPAYRPYLEACGIPAHGIVEAPHGALPRDLQALRTAGRKFRADLGLGNRPVLLYAGSLNDHYDVSNWLEVAVALAPRRPDAVLVIAGGGRRRAEVEAAAREYSNIRYLGTLPRAVLDGAIGAADLGLVSLSGAPSFSAVLPGKLVDLMSCAVPVISTVPGQTARIVELADAGWTAGQTPAAMRSALEAGLDAGPQERARRGDNGRSFVLQHLSAQSQARAVVEACELALAHSGPVSVGSWRDLLVTPKDPAPRLFHRDGGALAARAFDRWLLGPQDPPQPLR